LHALPVSLLAIPLSGQTMQKAQEHSRLSCILSNMHKLATL